MRGISVTQHQQQSLITYETSRFPLVESVLVLKTRFISTRMSCQVIRHTKILRNLFHSSIQRACIKNM